MKPPDDPDSATLMLTARIADGSEIDWNHAQPARGDAVDDATLDQLKAIASIAAMHRSSVDPARPDRITTWGSLVLIDAIGAGRFGEVHRAWDPQLQRQVALKL